MSIPNTNMHPNQFGAGSLSAPFSKRLDIATLATDADALDCLYLTYSDDVIPGGNPEVTPKAATVTVDGNGAGTQGRLTIKIKNYDANTGTANSDVSFTIDFDGAKSGWSSGAAVANSLKDVIDLLNADDAGGTSGKLLRGIKAHIGPGGLYGMYLQTAAMFQDLAETYIKPAGIGYTGCLKRDMEVDTLDSDYLVYWRLGMPEVRDRSLLKLLDLYGAIGTDTGCTVYVVRDDVEDYVIPTGTWATDFANYEIVYQVAAASLPAGSGASSNSVEHNPAFAGAERGPLAVIVKGDTGSAQTVNLVARLQKVVF